MKTLVVPVDDTEVAERAVPIAGALALAFDADVLLVTVDSPNIATGQDRARLEDLVAHLPAGARGRQQLDLVDVDVADDIVAVAAREPDAVVVMGTHARHAAAAAVLGSVADAVVRRATVPVVLVGPRCVIAHDPAGPVLVAVDGSHLDDALVDAACDWAAVTGVDLVAVHVRVPIAVDGGVIVSEPDGAPATRAVERALDRGVRGSTIDVDATSSAGGLVDAATSTRAGVVFVGTRRPGRLERAVLGSTADTVVRHARCPVVVIGSQPTAR